MFFIKFNKKIILGLVVISLIFACIIYIKDRFDRVLSRESVEVLKEIESPNGKNKVTIFYDGGSATVPENIRISITKNDDSNIYDSDVIFLLNRIKNASVRWISNNDIVIDYNRGAYSQEFRKIKKFKNINIEYRG
ncbi:Uncharacterised protein [[Clostridium] sordellii]|uniref:DUF5412 family protein n=1 Tax=Paraclostridium sordellii TaxID=1505 RepID=UPI0005DCC7E3|nr:DUF5412 family protein [Paeniclostridium sordellii]CEN23784.1 Uncharacterised protein [[Clostridium] sordellii] [Paeniclostridium sordellii]